MMNWVVILTLLAVIQVRVFKLTRFQFQRFTAKYCASLFLAGVTAECIRRLAEEFGFEWWNSIVVMFSSFLISETIFYSKGKKAKLSFYTFSTVLIGLARLTFGDSLSDWNLLISSGALSIASFTLSYAFLGIVEKLELSDVTKSFEETPIFLIATAVFVLIGSYIIR